MAESTIKYIFWSFSVDNNKYKNNHFDKPFASECLIKKVKQSKKFVDYFLFLFSWKEI